MNNALTRFTSSYARRASKYAAVLLVAGTSFLFMPQAQANMGLQATFWNNQTEDNQYNDAPPYPPTTNIVASIPVATVDQDFDINPIAGLVDDFVVKYEGYITANEAGVANLQCLADDGCIVIINGVTIINEWYDKGTSGDIYQYQMVPNQSLPFTVWYYENGGGAVIQLRWQLEGRDWAIVPESVFSTVPMAAPIIESPTETHTAQVPPSEETSTAPSLPQETTTPVDTPETETSPVVNDSETAVVEPVETPTLPSESNTQTIPVETSTPVVETPLPTPPPTVEPQPVVVIEPQPILLPEPEPELSEQPTPEEPPIEEVVSEPSEPETEEPLPVDEPSEHLEEEDNSEIPSDPDVQEQNEPTQEPSPQPVVEPGPTSQPDIAYKPPMVTLDNGVILTQEEAVAIVLLQNPAELLSELFTNPAAVFSALGSVGADMSPEVREESKKIVLSAVIAGNIATQAAATAGAVAAYRRKP